MSLVFVVRLPQESEETIVTHIGTETIKKTTLPHVTIAQLAACEQVMAQLKQVGGGPVLGFRGGEGGGVVVACCRLQTPTVTR